MSPGRKAEASEVRNWDGTVAAANELASQREWVVWGVGPEAPSFLGGEPGNDIAEAIARKEDPAWTELGEHEKWAVTLTGDEAGVLELLVESGSDMGYAPYLAPGKSEDARRLHEGTSQGRRSSPPEGEPTTAVRGLRLEASAHGTEASPKLLSKLPSRHGGLHRSCLGRPAVRHRHLTSATLPRQCSEINT